MKIVLDQVSKRFQKHWIFRQVNYTFAMPGSYCLLGPNGSGKSTLLRVVAGMQAPSLGKAHAYDAAGKIIPPNKLYHHVGFCAPGMEVVEEMTQHEFFEFHFSFKRLQHGLDIARVIELTGLKNAANKPIADYSSGMKQRVKLAQCIFADTSVLLLDEPCTNLDQQGVEQYRSWMERFGKDRLVIVASNDIREYDFCQEQISLDDYK